MTDKIKLDILSDVVCPWCIIGYKRLESVILQMGIEDRVEIEWHPFELNPHMPPEGEEIVGHMSGKYGMTRAVSLQNLGNMAQLGEEAGFKLDFFDGMKMVNTRDVHILLDYAKSHGLQTQLKLRLFEAFFSERKDVSDRKVLAGELDAVGLDVEKGLAALKDEGARERIQIQENYWLGMGISSVPTMVLNQSGFLRGAQGIDTYKMVLTGLMNKKEKILM
ncbi:DsbA family oxidoreductase [Desulfobacter hydrogenophilus]|uniref:DsbA family oxidoreductase n=2 Tax=Desulfobacter hydrogenophilus TaxID=2291 RepID=A0A328FHR5_9BACT|nr:DsbA family oxidoreductase [Desulfobacter hydrogenophilus]QBH15549.1 DsbA family oxidoreductase [Desulfobacter hydrogenophilus]RAM04029.1 DsbA family oxidoreductase [Desulfobacter hydrogenophilus]